MTWIFFLREPPRMLSCNNPGIAAKGEPRPLSHLSPAGFNDDPIALFDTFFCSRIGMDLNDWVPVKLSESWYLSVLCVKEPGRPRTRNQDIRIFLIEFRCAHRTFGGLPVLRERIVSHLFESRGGELKLPRGGGEPSLFVLVIFQIG